jgi:hypothetical protein
MSDHISSIEREIDKIRLQIYEETKDMTIEQKNEYHRKKAEAMIKKYDLKVVASK